MSDSESNKKPESSDEDESASSVDTGPPAHGDGPPANLGPPAHGDGPPANLGPPAYPSPPANPSPPVNLGPPANLTPPANLGATGKLGVPEKQAQDLGVHKIVFSTIPPPDMKPIKSADPQAITIVQEEYCSWERADDQKTRDVRKRLITASVICLCFISIEFTGGYISNSLAIAADATQLLTVFSTLMVSLFSLKVSNRRPHESFTYQRVEVVFALLSVLVTWVLTSVVMYLAFERIMRGGVLIDVDMMLATSAFGVVANLVMGMTLHNNCQKKYPGDSPCEMSANVRAAFIHIVCDFLFSLLVFITALFIDCCPDWHIVDPIATFVFAVFVLFITLAILKDILGLLVEGTPRGIYFNDVLKTFLTIEGVQQVQDLRLWALSLDKIALAAHLTIRPGADYNEVLKIASRRIHAKYNFYEMTIHIEAFQQDGRPHSLEHK